MNQSTPNSSSIDGLQTRSSLDDNGFTLSLCYGDYAPLELVSEDLAGLSAVGMGDFFGAQVYGFQAPYWDKQAFNRSSLEKRILRAFEVDMERSIDRASIYRTLVAMIGRVGLLPQETTRLYVSRVKPAGDSDCVAGYRLHDSLEFYKECLGQALEAPEGLGYSREVEVYLLQRLLEDAFGLDVPGDFRLLVGGLMYASMVLKAYYVEAGASHLWGIGIPEDGVAASLRSEPDDAKRARLERSRAMVEWVMRSSKDAAYVLAADDADGVFTECLKGFSHHFRETTPEIALAMYNGVFSSVIEKDDIVNAALFYAYKASGVDG